MGWNEISSAASYFLRAKQGQSRPILIRKGLAGFVHCQLGTFLDCAIKTRNAIHALPLVPVY